MPTWKNRHVVAGAFGATVLTLLFAVAQPHRAQYGTVASNTARDPLVAPAPHLKLAGVDNFAQVTPRLYRGAQPSTQGFRELKNLGVRIVVNLRDGKKQSESEQRMVTALGMCYVNIPLSSIHQPKDAQVAEFLELLRANPDQKIFLHCREGRDRTGVMVAALRIADEHWTPAQAINEMRAFHFHGFWLHSWKTYVEHFPQEFATDPSFRPLRNAVGTSPR